MVFVLTVLLPKRRLLKLGLLSMNIHVQANYALNSIYHLELAVKDVRRAASLSPLDPHICTCLKQWKGELSAQNAKDRSSFKNMFKGESFYQDQADENVVGMCH